MAKNSIWKLFSLGRIEATSLAAAGKPIVTSAAETVGGGGAHAAGHAANSAGTGILAGLGISSGSTLAGVTLMGGFAAVSAVTNYVEYLHERSGIMNFYREELAAQNHKSQNQVSDADLSAVENGKPRAGIAQNHVIKEAVDRERSHRNLGVAASFIASFAVFALMGALGVHPAIALSVPFAAYVGASALAYVAIKAPLEKIGKHMFGLNKETTHERIEEITRDRAHGKSITREQVVEVFVSANKQLSHYVEHTFGKEYDELSLADKVRVADELARMLPIDKIVNSINLGVTNASELAFSVEGQVSGVLPKSPEREQHPSTFQRFAERCRSMMNSVGGMFHAEKASHIAAIDKLHHEKKHQHQQQQLPVTTMEHGEESPIVEMNEPKFADRVGRKHDFSAGYRENIEAQRAEQVHLAGTQTVQ